MIRDFIRDHLVRWRWHRDIEAWSRVVTHDLTSSVRVLPPLYDWQKNGDL